MPNNLSATPDMEEFVFSPAKNTFLGSNAAGCFFISNAPLKILRLNRSLFGLLEHLEAGGKLSEFLEHHSALKIGQLLRELLLLTASGYLNLESTGEMDEYPKTSIIIPVRDQAEDLVECLQSLKQLDYPKDRFEVVVINDGSHSDLTGIIAPFYAKLINLEASQGPSAGRNIGAESASGDILAFMDADCVADKEWLRQLVPLFQADGVGAVGGFVAAYSRERYLERYEEVASPLNMGKSLIFEVDSRSTFYVPTCNFLVQNSVFRETGGFQPGLRLGEDVDFCWRMRKLGYSLVYVPLGRVAHKHRDELPKMLERRREYGTTEAGLYRSHPEKRKRLPFSVTAVLSLAALVLAIVFKNPYLISFILFFFWFDFCRKYRTLSKYSVAIPWPQLCVSILRSYFSFIYFALFHLVRYYLLIFLALGFLWHPLWFFSVAALLFTSEVDYWTKKPKLIYPVYLFYYALEHFTYQAGVFQGCLKLRYFRSYLPIFNRVSERKPGAYSMHPENKSKSIDPLPY